MWTIFSWNRKCFPFCRKKIQGIWKAIKVPLTSVLWCNSCKCRRPGKDNTVLRCIFLHKFSWYRPPCLHFFWIAQISLAFIPCILQPMFLLLIRLTLHVIWWKSESIIFDIHADISNHCRFISFWGPSMTKKMPWWDNGAFTCCLNSHTNKDDFMHITINSVSAFVRMIISQLLKPLQLNRNS